MSTIVTIVLIIYKIKHFGLFKELKTDENQFTFPTSITTQYLKGWDELLVYSYPTRKILKNLKNKKKRSTLFKKQNLN
jgi:hypothetical protein